MCWHPLILSGTASTSAPHPDPAALTNPATEPHRELPRLPVCAQGTQGLTAAAKAQPKATSLFSSVFVPSFSCRALGHLSPFFPHCFQRGNFSPVSKEPAARQPEAPQLWRRRAGHTVHKHWQQRCTRQGLPGTFQLNPFSIRVMGFHPRRALARVSGLCHKWGSRAPSVLAHCSPAWWYWGQRLARVGVRSFPSD